jgi:hypothetical protein
MGKKPQCMHQRLDFKAHNRRLITGTKEERSVQKSLHKLTDEPYNKIIYKLMYMIGHLPLSVSLKKP